MKQSEVKSLAGAAKERTKTLQRLAAKKSKPLLKTDSLPPLSALATMSPLERARVMKQVARNREETARRFTAKSVRNEDQSTIEFESLVGECEDEDEDKEGSEDEDDEDDDETACDVKDDEHAPRPRKSRNSFEESPFQPRPERKRPGLFTPAWCDHVTGNLTEARVLAQLVYWFGISRKTQRCRARIERDGFLWIYKHYPALARETRLSKKQVADAVRGLITRGIVIVRRDAEHGRLLRLNPVAIEKALKENDSCDEQ